MSDNDRPSTPPRSDRRGPVPSRVIVPGTVDSLTDGSVFSLDGGMTWHVCALVMVGGAVAVYASVRRDDDAPTVRIIADGDDPCLVLT